MTYYIPNETPEQQRTRYAKERETFISKLVDLQLAIIAMRNHAKFTRGKLDLDVPEYRDLLEAFYQLSEIDAVQEVADTIRWADEDLYGNPIGSRAAREASRAFDEAGVL